jgi:hypothetical protein
LKSKYYYFKTDFLEEVFILESEKEKHLVGKTIYQIWNDTFQTENQIGQIFDFHKDYCREIEDWEIVKYKLLGSNGS